MEFYKILKMIMNEKALSVADVARICNVPDSTIRGAITRKSNSIALSVAFKLSKGLNVPLEVLNGDDESQLKKLNAISSENGVLSSKEKSLLTKYRVLDNFAKKAVENLIENELERLVHNESLEEHKANGSKNNKRHKMEDISSLDLNKLRKLKSDK